MDYGKLTVINASKEDPKRRAFSFGHNAFIEGGELHVVDDQASATGYEINAHGPQSGDIGEIHARVSVGDGAVELRSGSENLSYVMKGAAEPSGSPSEPP